MPFTGSDFTTEDADGRSGPGVFQKQQAAAVNVEAAQFDAVVDDIAAGLSGCLQANGAKAATANISLGSNKITNLANGTASGDALHFGQFALASHTPTLSALGTTFSATTNVFKYVRIPASNLVYVTIEINGSFAAATSPYLRATLPINAAARDQYQPMVSFIGAAFTLSFVRLAPTYIEFQKSTFANYAATTGTNFYFHGFYEAA